jgi:hypothetical protein
MQKEYNFLKEIITGIVSDIELNLGATQEPKYM